MQPDLFSLAARVEALTGPDREVDVEVARLLRPDWQIINDMMIDDFGYAIGLPRLTASVDAVLALIARELPGWAWSVSMIHAAFLAEGELPFVASIMSSARVVLPGMPELAYDTLSSKAATGATPALALLSAALRAKAQQHQSGDDQ